MVSKRTKPKRVSNVFETRVLIAQRRIKDKYGIELTFSDITELFAQPKIYFINGRKKKKITKDDLSEAFPF